MFKWIKRIALVVVLLVVIGGVILYFSLNSILRTQIQQQSSKSLNLPTDLGSASLAIFGGDLSLKDYSVASPPGFSDQPMLKLGGLDVKVSYGQLTSNPARIEAITIDKPRFLLEQKDGKFNIKAMTENLPGNKPNPTVPNPTEPAPSDPAPTPPSDPSEPAAPGETMKLIIDQLTVNEAEVVIRPGLPGLAEEIPVKLGTFDIKNIGNADGAQNGVAVKQVITQLLTEMAARAGKEGGLPTNLKAILEGDLTSIAQQYLPGDVAKFANLLNAETLKDPTKAIGTALQDVTGGATTNPAGAVGDVVKDITSGEKPEDALKGLLGGSKKDEPKKDEKKKDESKKGKQPKE